jgi:ribonuclease P/MRP protein subunit RPP40
MLECIQSQTTVQSIRVAKPLIFFLPRSPTTVTMAHSRVMLTNGTLPSAQLNRLCAAHPFTQQLDIVFPASDELEKALTSLKPTYCKRRCTLSEFLDFASTSPGRNITALPSTSECVDTWCIDPRGVLTLCVSKSLYEQLGLIGKRLPFKGCPEQYGLAQ